MSIACAVGTSTPARHRWWSGEWYPYAVVSFSTADHYGELHRVGGHACCLLFCVVQVEIAALTVFWEDAAAADRRWFSSPSSPADAGLSPAICTPNYFHPLIEEYEWFLGWKVPALCWVKVGRFLRQVTSVLVMIIFSYPLLGYYTEGSGDRSSSILTKRWITYGESVDDDTFLAASGNLGCGDDGCYASVHLGAQLCSSTVWWLSFSCQKPSLVDCEILREGRSLVRSELSQGPHLSNWLCFRTCHHSMHMHLIYLVTTEIKWNKAPYTKAW